MIVMIEEGRLGNQIFQYLALRKSIKPHEVLVMLGCQDLSKTFDGVRARIIPIDQGPFRHLRSLDTRRLSLSLRRVRLGGLLSENDRALPVRHTNKGLVLCDRAWFQSPDLLREDALKELEIKPHWLQEARLTLHHYGLESQTTILLHARGRDYRTWPSVSSPAFIPPRWFAHQVESLCSSTPATSVLIVGDDPDYSQEVQKHIPNSQIHQASGPGAQSHDFALLSLSKYLIISPSTFGFWGAWFARRMHANGRAIAPKFWAGHRSNDWFPVTMQTDFLEYSEVFTF